MKKRKNTIKYGAITSGVLRCFAEVITLGLKAAHYKKGGLAMVSLIDYLADVLEPIKDEKIKKKKVRRVLENLEKKQILYIEEKKDNVYVYLKDKNHPKIVEYSIKSLLDLKMKKEKWDGKWFMVFFDVPEIQRIKRDYLRKFLKKIGFYQYQESVYIFPYECEKEVNLIKKIVEGAKYMKYIIAEKIEDEEKIRRFFGI